MEMIIGKEIKKLREKKGYSQRKLMILTGVSNATINRIENGIVKPGPDTLAKLAGPLGISYEKLLMFCGYIDNSQIVKEEIEEYLSDDSIESAKKIDYIPVVGVIRAGDPILAQQNIIGYEILPKSMPKDYDYFGLKVIGDSMNNSRIMEGDIVIVRKQNDVDGGTTAVVLVDDENATIKKYYKHDGIVTLMPNSSNPKHQPRIIDTKKTCVKVIGKVVRNIMSF